ncbi:DUF4870 domain-containing protein [Leucobacter musarum]|uniref:DUF4870 domain-containing protein n=1 Tax=Leucobacter musarum TaxID=1930747 RepID=UPI0006A7EA9D|nr:DUF4870 domain-containing protein [Leucobacter musarum]
MSATEPAEPQQEQPQPQYAPPQAPQVQVSQPQPQYAPPQYAQPQYAPPQYAHPQPQQAYAAPGQPNPYAQYARPATGAAAWAVGLIACSFIPGVSAIAACIVMLIVGAQARKRGGLAEANGRAAMNWAFTYLFATIVLLIAHLALLLSLTDTEYARGFFPIGIPITIWLLLSIVHVVFSIVGLVRASSGKEFRAWSIPVIR